MSKQIYVNLAVKDLKKSIAFFTALGFAFNAEFTNDDGACMVVDSNIYVMLLREDFFQTFTDRKPCDLRTHVETLIALTEDSREAVDSQVAKAVAAGGRALREPKDYGFMYSHSFEDLDGHIWELLHMSAQPGQC
jgi:predicted lactoylglutathione lyase